MNTDIDTVAKRVDCLESQNRRMKIATYGIWPVVWAVTIVLVIIPGKFDAKAVTVLLVWAGGALGLLLIGMAVLFVIWFLLRLAVDFKNRNSRFYLNPGSRAHDPQKKYLAEKVVASDGDKLPV